MNLELFPMFLFYFMEYLSSLTERKDTAILICDIRKS